MQLHLFLPVFSLHSFPFKNVELPLLITVLPDPFNNKTKDKKGTKQELEKRKNTLLDNDLGKQKEIQKANFYILNTQEKLH